MTSLPVARFRVEADDFVVEELPAYAPSGAGEHLHVVFEKRELTTFEAVRRIARALDSDERGVGTAGLKDRHARTTQAATFPFPIARGSAEDAAKRIDVPGVRVLSVARHEGKLKPGHLAGNRFEIRLRGLDADASDAVRARLAIAASGVPNAFGPQRFGREGSNPERAFAWLAGRTKIRDRREQRLLFSALQSLLYNRVLERRVEAGTWNRVLAGDVAKKTDTGGLFTVPLEGPERDDAIARGEAGRLVATGPMFGVKMRWPEGEPGALEREILAEAVGDASLLANARHAGEGTRRPLVLAPRDLASDVVPDGLLVRFVLPKGGYATTVLGFACRLVDASREDRDDASPEIDPEGDPY